MSSEYILSGDPVLSFARNRLKITGIWQPLLLAWTAALLSLLLIPWLTGTLDLIEKDIPSIVLALVILPTIAVFYFSLQVSMQEELEKGIYKTNVLSMKGGIENQSWDHTRISFSSRKIFYVALFLTAVGLGMHIYDIITSSLPGLYWYYNPLYPYYFWILRVPLTGLFIYIGVMFSLRQLYLLWSIYKFFKIIPSVNLQVLHPDRCGGLAFLGDFSLQITYFVGLIGILIGTLFTASTYVYHFNPLMSSSDLLLLIAYLLGANSLFFLPLWSAHKKMKQAKTGMLHDISATLDRLFKKIQQEITKEGELSIDSFQELDNLRTIYDIANSFPVWPFDLGTLKRLGAVLVSPFFTPIIYALWEWLTKLTGYQNFILFR